MSKDLTMASSVWHEWYLCALCSTNLGENTDLSVKLKDEALAELIAVLSRGGPADHKVLEPSGRPGRSGGETQMGDLPACRGAPG